MMSFTTLGDLLGDVIDEVAAGLPELQRRALDAALLRGSHTVALAEVRTGIESNPTDQLRRLRELATQGCFGQWEPSCPREPVEDPI